MNKDLFKTQWKLLANNKQLTAWHFIERAILIAMSAKNLRNVPGEDIVASILQKNFTPNLRGGSKYPSIEQFVKRANSKWFKLTHILNLPVETILDEKEQQEFMSYARHLRVDKLGRKYVYYFTTQEGLTTEQQGVQGAHVAFVRGQYLKDMRVEPHHTYFQWIGVKDEKELIEVSQNHPGQPFVTFRESDLENRLTGLAFHPILWNKRDEFLHYELLTH